MATHLTVDDLAHFLSQRKSANCKMAADWVQDHPDDEKVLRAVDRLEDFLIDLGHHPLIVSEMDKLAPLEELLRGPLPRALGPEACLCAFDGRFDIWPARGAAALKWMILVNHARAVFRTFAPAWAVALVKLLRPPAPRPPEEPDTPRPGPYHYDPEEDFHNTPTEARITDDSGDDVAIVQALGKELTARDKATALLLAASPEMYEALLDIIGAANENSHPIHFKVREAIDRARLVVLRAREGRD